MPVTRHISSMKTDIDTDFELYLYVVAPSVSLAQDVNRGTKEVLTSRRNVSRLIVRVSLHIICSWSTSLDTFSRSLTLYKPTWGVKTIINIKETLLQLCVCVYEHEHGIHIPCGTAFLLSSL